MTVEERTRAATPVDGGEGLSRAGAAWRVFLTCWLLYALHFATNTVREIYPALSLGDHGSFDVSEYVGFHPDIIEIPGRGAFINNNPGASIVGAVPYLLARPVIDRAVAWHRQARAAADGAPREYASDYPMARDFFRLARARGLDLKFALGAASMQMLGMAPLTALSAVVMFYVLVGLTGRIRPAAVLAVLYAVATPVFYRTAQLNHNLLVAHSAFFAFALLWRPWDGGRAPRPRHFLLAGLLAGWAVVCDYSGLIALAFVGLYAVVRWWGRSGDERRLADLWLFGAGVAASGVVLLLYQWSSFGHPLLPAQHYMPPVRFSDLGYAGMDRPHGDLLWETAFGLRYGLFTSAPLLLLALYPPAWRAASALAGRRETWCIGLFCVLFFLFCSANQYGRMQFNTGVRHIVPVAPFLFLVSAVVLLRLPRPLAVAIGLAGAYWSWCLAMYRDVELGLGIPESLVHVTLEGFRLPWMVTLERMGYIQQGASATPLLLLFAAATWVLWAPLGRGDPPARQERADARGLRPVDPSTRRAPRPLGR